MIAVSDAWKAIHRESILPESHIELTYRITEPGAQALAVESNNGVTFYSDHTAIVETTDKVHPKYATLEHNLWKLDGSFAILPENEPYGDTGYVADVSNAEITISFPTVREYIVPGVTIVWSETYGEYATRCRVTARNGVETVATKEFENNSIRSTFELPISGYDSITLEVLEWCIPEHRPRIERFYLGAIEVYTDSSLVNYTHEQSADILSTSLPKNEISFSLDNSSGVWNPENPVGNVRYLIDRQEVAVRYGYKLPTGIEWVKGGTFWVSGWETPTNGLEATFTARDLLEFMDAVYTGPKAGTLYEIVMAALTQANLPTTETGATRYYVDEVLKTIDTDFTNDDSSYSIAVILQMCANAGQCIMRQTREGILRIERYARQLSDYEVKEDISYTHPEFTLSKPPKVITINDGLWVENIAPVGEEVTVNNPLISTQENAEHVSHWVAAVLRCRKIVKGTFRPDPRLDALDVVSVESKYSAGLTSAVTDISYSYNGAFQGTYTGREIEVQ